MKPGIGTLAIVSAMLMSAGGGCVSAKLGTQYEQETHVAAIEGPSKAVFYVDDAVDAAIHYYAYVDGDKAGHLFPGTFTVVAVDPGRHRVMVSEWWTGEGFGGAIKDVFVSPFSSSAELPMPEALMPGAESTLEISVRPGDVVYIRISKSAEAEEYFYECEITAETTTMCQGERTVTEIETVAAPVAQEELQGYRESL